MNTNVYMAASLNRLQFGALQMSRCGLCVAYAKKNKNGNRWRGEYEK